MSPYDTRQAGIGPSGPARASATSWGAVARAAYTKDHEQSRGGNWRASAASEPKSLLMPLAILLGLILLLGMLMPLALLLGPLAIPLGKLGKLAILLIILLLGKLGQQLACYPPVFAC